MEEKLQNSCHYVCGNHSIFIEPQRQFPICAYLQKSFSTRHFSVVLFVIYMSLHVCCGRILHPSVCMVYRVLTNAYPKRLVAL